MPKSKHDASKDKGKDKKSERSTVRVELQGFYDKDALWGILTEVRDSVSNPLRDKIGKSLSMFVDRRGGGALEFSAMADDIILKNRVGEVLDKYISWHGREKGITEYTCYVKTSDGAAEITNLERIAALEVELGEARSQLAEARAWSNAYEREAVSQTNIVNGLLARVNDLESMIRSVVAAIGQNLVAGLLSEPQSAYLKKAGILSHEKAAHSPVLSEKAFADSLSLAGLLSSGDGSKKNFIFSYITQILTSNLVHQLTKYYTGILQASMVDLEKRSSLVSGIKRDVLYKHVAETLPENSSLSLLLERAAEYFETEAGNRKQVIDQLKKKLDSISDDASECASVKSEHDRESQNEYRLRKTSQKARMRKSELDKQLNAYCIIVPFNAEDTIGMRFVLPINANAPVPSGTLLDYLRSAITIELATTFQEEAFGAASLDDFVCGQSIAPNGTVFYSIDILNISEDAMQDVLSFASSFLSELINTPEKYFGSRGLSGLSLDSADSAAGLGHNKPYAEPVEANIYLFPLVFPLRDSSLVSDYVEKNIKPEIESLWNELKQVFMATFGNMLSEDAAMKILSSPLHPQLFEEKPYCDVLESLCEEHGPKLAVHASKALNIEQIRPKQKPAQKKEEKGEKGEKEEKEDEPLSPKEWMSFDKAVNAYFMGTPEKFAKTTLDNAISVNAVRVRDESGVVYVSIEDMEQLHTKIVKIGNRISGVYPASVMSAPEFADKYNIDRKKLNSLLDDPDFKKELGDALLKKVGVLRVIRDDPATIELILLKYDALYMHAREVSKTNGYKR